MPFRGQERVDLCGVCKEHASESCLRCGQPLCGAHAPEQGRRCESCESFHDQNAPTAQSLQFDRERKTRTALVPTVALSFAVAVGLAAVVAGIAGGMGVASTVAFLVGLLGSPHLVDVGLRRAFGLGRARKKWRKQFLRERKPRLLTAAEAEPDSGDAQ